MPITTHPPPRKKCLTANTFLQQHNTASLWQRRGTAPPPRSRIPLARSFLRGDTLDQNLSPLLLIIPLQSRDLHTIPVEEKELEEGGGKKKKTKAGKPSCVRVRLVHEYLICDQDLQYMHGKSWREEHLRNSTASLHENTTQGRRRWPLRCDDRGVCVCFVNSPGSHLLV